MEWDFIWKIGLFLALMFSLCRGHKFGGGHHGCGCCGPKPPVKPQVSSQPSRVVGLTDVRFTVAGMTCQHCAGTVEDALLKISGVHSVKVNLQANKVEVSFDPAVTNSGKLKQAIRDSGYEAD